MYKADNRSKKAGSEGVSPEIVAKKIFKAANDSSDKLRYSVGSPAPWLLFIRRILPDRIFFWLIRKNYKL